LVREFGVGRRAVRVMGKVASGGKGRENGKKGGMEDVL
jgi:hypothetical protein